jgi:hypothetical protein
MHVPDVLDDAGLVLGAMIAVRTLEHRVLAALDSHVTRQ